MSTHGAGLLFGGRLLGQTAARRKQKEGSHHYRGAERHEGRPDGWIAVQLQPIASGHPVEEPGDNGWGFDVGHRFVLDLGVFVRAGVDWDGCLSRVGVGQLAAGDAGDDHGVLAEGGRVSALSGYVGLHLVDDASFELAGGEHCAVILQDGDEYARGEHR